MNNPIFYIPERIERLNQLVIIDNQHERRFSSILLIVWGGSGFIDVNKVSYSLECGSILAFPGTSALELRPQLGLHGIWIEYSALKQGQPEFSPLNSKLSPQLQASKQILSLAEDLYEAWSKPDQSQPFAVQQLFSGMLSELYNESYNRSLLQSSGTWLDVVLQYIDTHYNEDLTRSQMAALANVTPEHFSRTFRKATGQTFNAYILLLRIRKAQQRILTGVPNLTELALEVGYNEGTYLSRKFKQVVGLSPTAYLSKPKRIVALNYNHTASLRALEITPQLGAYSAWLESVDYVPANRRLFVENMSSSDIYASVASVRPDVIINYSQVTENKILLPLAPVIELPFKQMSWREQFSRIATIADRQPQAEAWLEHYDELCSKAGQRLDQSIGLRGTAIVWEIDERTAYCFSSSFGRGCQVLYGDLGFSPPAKIVDRGIADTGYIEASIEAVAEYPADHILITGIPSSPEGRLRLSRLFQSERWLSLEAVRRNRVYLLNQSNLFYGFDPLSTMAQLQVLIRALTS
ncbi:AraC family transcriptional regulator [Paenibacillus albidus]|uniref:AraC family transcriptional regulator n=1 Tax=Paenibacillus albidus TaxID=2041023 RepID=UPI001BEA1F4C|nr:AraC family transcriptional regulator [Paenibacillus albidus]MBT2290770.1 AraC family transcriptional regulator [Paenibacillus albidus]